MDDEEGLTITKSASQGKTIVHYLLFLCKMIKEDTKQLTTQKETQTTHSVPPQKVKARMKKFVTQHIHRYTYL